MKSYLLIFMCLLQASVSGQNNRYDPPWNKPLQGAPNFTVKGVDNLPDIYGDINDPQLVIFMGGNQFMVVDELLAAFKKQHPEYKRILVETLPPGILFEQIKTGTLVIGNMRVSLQADVYTAGLQKLLDNNPMFDTIAAISVNKLALMVARGNPKNIGGIADLGRDDLRISMPNKKFEGIANNIEAAYKLAGGEALLKKIMVTKLQNGTTYLTQIHHRQSPMRILYNQSDVAPVWETEILYQQMLGNAIEAVAIPPAYNKQAVTAAGVLKLAPHKQAATYFVQFLLSTEAQNIFLKYGFQLPGQ